MRDLKKNLFLLPIVKCSLFSHSFHACTFYIVEKKLVAVHQFISNMHGDDALGLEISTGGLNNPEFLRVITETEDFAKTQLEEDLRSHKELTARLGKQVRDKNGEIDRLLRKIERLSEEKDEILHQSGDTIAEKLIGMTKKNRALNLETEREKTKVRNLEREVKEMRENHENVTRVIQPEPAPEAVEYNKMRAELNLSQTRSAESRNECQRLRQELRIAHRALQNEVGEDASLDEILKSASDPSSTTWRGRSQKIALLNTKITELRNKCRSEASTIPTKDQQKLVDTAVARRKEVEAIKIELEDLRKKIGDKDREISALRSRASHQSQEGKTLRSRIKILSEKGQHDDELIETLSKRLQILQKTLNESPTRTMTLGGTQGGSTKVKLTGEDMVEMSKLKQIIGEKESGLSTLKADIVLLNNEIATLSHNSRANTGFELEKEQLSAELNSLKSEHDSIRKMCRDWQNRLKSEHPDVIDARFGELFQSKQDDLSVYEATIEQTRKVFMAAMKQMKTHVRQENQ